MQIDKILCLKSVSTNFPTQSMTHAFKAKKKSSLPSIYNVQDTYCLYIFKNGVTFNLIQNYSFATR